MSYPYMNVHLLIPTAVANANRDDMGAPKSAIYGRVPRLRWSSQSQKRARRMTFEEASPEDRSVRSKTTASLVADFLAGGDADKRAALLPKVRTAIASLTRNDPKALDDDDTKDAPGGDKKDTLVWLTDKEVRKIADHLAASDDPGFESLTKTTSLAVASFGRMFAASPELDLEAACQCAHAITTHEAVTEIDYFTAVDDHQTVGAGKGAGHIGLRQYGSGVFYSFLCMDRNQLLENWAETANSDAGDRVRLLWDALLCSTPNGMKANAPIGGFPAFIYAVEATHPATLVGAFEDPVVPSHAAGLLAPSIQRLTEWANSVGEFAGDRFGRSWWASAIPTTDVTMSGPVTAETKMPSLAALVAALAEWTLP